LNEVGTFYKKDKWRFNILTSAPSLINALKKSNEWACTHYGRNTPHKGDLKSNVGNLTSGSENRLTASFELK